MSSAVARDQLSLDSQFFCDVILVAELDSIFIVTFTSGIAYSAALIIGTGGKNFTPDAYELLQKSSYLWLSTLLPLPGRRAELRIRLVISSE